MNVYAVYYLCTVFIVLPSPPPEPEKMKSMSQLAVLSRRWSPAHMRLEAFREVVLESSGVEELKEKVTPLKEERDVMSFRNTLGTFCRFYL